MNEEWSKALEEQEPSLEGISDEFALHDAAILSSICSRYGKVKLGMGEDRIINDGFERIEHITLTD